MSCAVTYIVSGRELEGQTACCYIPVVRELLRKSPRFFAWVGAGGLALRLLFFFLSPQVTDDSRIYADIANNWLAYHTYGVTEAGRVVPTYIRLPGYPAFLACVFAVFGKNNFNAVLLIQILVDLGSCLVVADMARRMVAAAVGQPGTPSNGPLRTARVAFLLAVLCPFLANYAAAALTETLEIFFTALALDFAVSGLDPMFAAGKFRADSWIGCGVSVAAAILLRPDGGILLIAIGMYLALLLVGGFRSREDAVGVRQNYAARIVSAGAVVLIVSLAPLVPWSLRNWYGLHHFEPLAPRYATNAGEYVPLGFDRWVKTWMVDYVSVQEIYWQEPGGEIDPEKLPARAFDDPEQKERTLAILGRYNQTKEIGEGLDKKFAALAAERIHNAPFRYYVLLPALRMADMWLRPRTELTQADPRWWEFNDDWKYSGLSVAFGLTNLVCLVLGGMGLIRHRFIHWFGLLVLFVAVRSLFLGSLENPETRYTLECYPVVIVLAAVALARRGQQNAPQTLRSAGRR